MFIKKWQYNRLIERITKLERQNETHARFLHKDYERLENYFKRIKQISEFTGIEDNRLGLWDSRALSYLLGYDTTVKPLSLAEKVDGIMKQLDLTVVHTEASTKVAKKPVKATPIKKTTKRGK